MFNNLLKHSIRSFKRQRAYVIINILGLAIGIACSLLITLYVINEASYDRFNVKKDRIFLGNPEWEDRRARTYWCLYSCRNGTNYAKRTSRGGGLS